MIIIIIIIIIIIHELSKGKIQKLQPKLKFKKPQLKTRN